MISQKVKRWFQKLFAWWPWRRTTATTTAQAYGNAGLAQEPVRYAAEEGHAPQTGMLSIAVDQSREEVFPDFAQTQRKKDPEEQPPESSSLPPAQEPSPSPYALSYSIQPVQYPSSSETGEASGLQRQLEFLRYLMQRGIINEGFEEGKEPRQYRKRSSVQ
ncbi:hypothetical protein EI42_05142 [Thermosporothrix hazakensis]|jgi:hypothetical protein|uniref:Uncharacterized protein n=1 Tax=Thermosporothrix hazakensis TaxID=644383 RepID=A0A326U000_THEHA|nr:hypothetical protein [Thermosporothrix hazakensis]PZW23344.1 hypothetical protein EI42_05142 [Thermosporothrix hazakensis]GCE47729.1 hypothetical protein KTH_25980 [Thermosporothrix hazakensis]